MVKIKLVLRVGARERITNRGDFAGRPAGVESQQERERALVELVMRPGNTIEIDESLEGAGRAAGERGQTGKQPQLGGRHWLIERRSRPIAASLLYGRLTAQNLADESGVIGA